MKFTWKHYKDGDAPLLERWLDEEARRFTGCSDGWLAYYDYWIHDESIQAGENFWVFLAGEDTLEAVFVFGQASSGLFTVSECFVDPSLRGKGIGSAALRELIQNASVIIGREMKDVQAVVYPDNIASRRMFEKVGFRLAATHPDGDALYYHYATEMLCWCGHDCGKCITRTAAVLQNSALKEKALHFHSALSTKNIGFEDIICYGGRSGTVCQACAECPFMQCCRKKKIAGCYLCETPCEMWKTYKDTYVNRCHQI